MKYEHKEGSVEAIVAGAVISPGLDDLATDYAQLGLDAIIDGDALSELPVAKSVVAVVRMGVGVRNRLFARKLLDFLAGFREVSEWERRDMVSRLEADPAYGRRVGEHLMELFDRIESIKKPKMIARVFQAYANNSIDAIMLHRLCSAIERLPAFEIDGVRALSDEETRNRVPLPTLQNLQYAGLAIVGSGYGGGMVFQPSEIAETFLVLQLDM